MSKNQCFIVDTVICFSPCNCHRIVAHDMYHHHVAHKRKCCIIWHFKKC